jgi:hypothetical protein
MASVTASPQSFRDLIKALGIPLFSAGVLRSPKFAPRHDSSYRSITALRSSIVIPHQDAKPSPGQQTKSYKAFKSKPLTLQYVRVFASAGIKFQNLSSSYRLLRS